MATADTRQDVLASTADCIALEDVKELSPEECTQLLLAVGKNVIRNPDTVDALRKKANGHSDTQIKTVSGSLSAEFRSALKAKKDSEQV